MKVAILGIDGYLGWTLAVYLVSRGYEVVGLDNLLRRRCVQSMGSDSVIPIGNMDDRVFKLWEMYGTGCVNYRPADLRDWNATWQFLDTFLPDVVVHFAEIPSAPYSMISLDNCVLTQVNNVVGTLNVLYAIKQYCPKTHLIKLGTMGEYGTPNVEIPEGFFDIEYKGRKDRLPFPKQAGSWYHQSKVHDTNNIMMACKLWNLKATDIMQGVVFGTHISEMQGDPQLLTRFDIDEAFGTAINRFCAQALIGHPLTVYGKGGQTRGFLPLKDSMQCIELLIKRPPKNGEYRVVNQFQDLYTVRALASLVQGVASDMGYPAEIEHTDNPRLEAEEHFYEVEHETLKHLGYEPTLDTKRELIGMFHVLENYKDRINRDVIVKDIKWTR